MADAHPAFTLVLALAMGVLVQSLARHLRVPGIVLLLATGAALGPDLLGWIEPRSLGDGLFSIVHLSVAVILFEGGLNLEISRLRREQSAIRLLVTLGAGVTLLGAALAAHALFDVSFMQALLFGSLVVVTGPTVIGPLIQELRLRPRVATVLEAEGVLIDPIGALLAVVMLELVLAPASAETYAGEVTGLLLRFGFGTGAGVAAGFCIAGLLRVRRLVPEGLENITVLASVLLLFQGCEELLSESGILAVTVAGVVVGNLRSPSDRDLREFKDQLTVMMIGLLFVLLAADVRLEDVRSLGWPGVGLVTALVVVVRPLGVWLSTLGSDLTRNERWFIAWIAPRGIIAAAVASITASALENAGIPGGPEMRAMVFLTIASTVILAGITAGPVATLLGVRLPGREQVAILGAQGLGLAVAVELRESGRPVIFLDSNPQNCRLVEEAGFPVVFGDALQERTLQRARFEGVGEVVGLTPNQMLNGVFVTRSRERFQVPQGYIAVDRAEKGLAPEILEKGEARMLFEGPNDVERWDVRARHGSLEVQRWEFLGEPEEPVEPPAETPRDIFVILTVRRGDRVQLMYADLELQVGDVAAVAIHVPEADLASAALRARGFAIAKAEESDEES